MCSALPVQGSAAWSAVAKPRPPAEPGKRLAVPCRSGAPCGTAHLGSSRLRWPETGGSGSVGAGRSPRPGGGLCPCAASWPSLQSGLSCPPCGGWVLRCFLTLSGSFDRASGNREFGEHPGAVQSRFCASASWGARIGSP